MEKVPFTRMALTEDQFRKEVAAHKKMNRTLPRVISSKDVPLFDWEAGAVARIRKNCEGDEEALCLLSAFMQLVTDDVKRQNAENAAKLVPKPPRANTAGMFFAKDVPLSQQSHLASN